MAALDFKPLSSTDSTATLRFVVTKTQNYIQCRCTEELLASFTHVTGLQMEIYTVFKDPCNYLLGFSITVTRQWKQYGFWSQKPKFNLSFATFWTADSETSHINYLSLISYLSNKDSDGIYLTEFLRKHIYEHVFKMYVSIQISSIY